MFTVLHQPSASRSRPNGLVLVLVPIALGVALGSGCSSFASRGQNAQGVRLFQQARYDEAMRQFQQATYTSPDNADGYYNLAATCHRLGVLNNDRQLLDQAENYYNQCLDHQPNHRDCYRGLAVLLAEQGRSEEAFRLVQGWVDREPNLSDAKIELARLCEEFGKRGEAQEHLVEALALEPTNARALAAMGKIREEMGDPQQAIRNYQQSLASNRFQPQLASRVAALQASGGTASSAALSQDGTRLVDRNTTTLR